MPLVECPNCGQGASAWAKTCHHCGYKFMTLAGCIAWLAGILAVAWVALALVFGGLFSLPFRFVWGLVR